MTEDRLKIIIGGLLHDIGKVLFRASDGRNHSQSGYEFLRDAIQIKDEDILDQVHYHHANMISAALLRKNSPAYITYIADNIASAADRRKNSSEEQGFDKSIGLESIFNILNGNKDKAHYQPKTLDVKDGINYPTEDEIIFHDSFYREIQDKLRDILRNMEYSDTYINSLLEVVEGLLSYVPSSTNKGEIADISLYDHMKLTAALGSCIHEYMISNHIDNYKDELYVHAKDFYNKKVFLLYSIDLSGIQAFIYNQYGNKDVLKNLRSRSFYLEIMMENVIDDILKEINLSRANLIYSGGGHAYLILPNTLEVRQKVDDMAISFNRWLQEQFKADLYAGCAYTECSASDLENKTPDSYRSIFRSVSNKISERKICRYSAIELREINNRKADSHERECRICHRSDHLTGDNLCIVCDGLIRLSKKILTADFFTIVNTAGLPVGKDRYLVTDNEQSLLKKIKEEDGYIRSYGKNKMFTGKSISTKLWVGDYCSAETLEELVDQGIGFKRMGVLRADVDNLGQAFVAGFPEEYQTLSRSATFSRKLSLFFKNHVNEILEHGDYSLDGHRGPRNAAIIYSGGDDIFIVGAWKDILEFAVDLYRSVKRFTQKSLTISCGYGIFHDRYPISYIASKTGDLEDYSKDLEGKNAITLFDNNHRYHWDEFIEEVIEEKFNLIYEYFSISTSRGKNFLYNMLDLLRNREDKINLARFAYFLARMEPDDNSTELEKELYQKFSRKMYEWMLDNKDSKQAITAIYIYTYLVRQGEEE